MAHFYEINEAVFGSHRVWGVDRVAVDAAVVKDGAPVVVRDSGTTNERPVYDVPNGTVIPQPLATANSRIEGYVQGEAPVDLVVDYGQPDEYTQRWSPPQTGPTGSSTALDVSDFPLIPPEADDSGRFERWQAAAIAQGRDMSNYEDLVINGVSILSGATILGPGKLIVSEDIGQAAPLYTPPGSQDIRVYCELDGNKANIDGDPDETANPQNLWFVDGTVANPCERVYYAGHAHDSKRQGVVFRNVRQGGLYGLIENNDRDGATLYQNCRDIDVGLILSNCGDDHFAINSGELDQIGLCEGITGWVIVRGPSDRAKGRGVTVRGGRGIHLNIMASDPSQSALVLNNFGDVPLTDFHIHVQAYRPGQGGGAGAEKHGVMLEVGDGDGYIGNGKVTGRITGALDHGVMFVNSKGVPARGDFRGLEIDVEVDGAANGGINADAPGIDDCLINGNVHGCGGWGFSKTSLGYRNRIRGDYYNNANGVRARVQGDGEIDVRTYDTRAGGARTQHVGLNIFALFDHFKLNYASWGNIDQDVQDDGDHVATWVRPTPANHHGTHEPGGTDPMAVDAAAATGSLRTTGFTGNKAMPGTARLDQIAAPTAPVPFGGQRATGAADPIAATDLATRQWVETFAQGYQQHPAVRAASVVNQPLGAQGSRTVDGVACASGDRVLLKAQTAAAENGLYVVNADFSLSRAADGTVGNLKAGATVWVNEGTTNQDTAWTLITDDPITVGTTAQTWTQSSGLGQVTAGAGLAKTGSQLDVGAGPGIIINADSIEAANTYGTLAGRPTAAAAGDRAFYYATDVNGGTLYQVQSGAWVPIAPEADLAIGALDVYGHSYTTAIGTVTGGGRNGYVDKLVRGLGAVQRRRNFGVFGAVAAWQSQNASGDGGWPWVVSQVAPPATIASPPYEAQANVAIVHFGLNDLASLGSLKPRPYTEAMRNILSSVCAAARAEDSDAAWAFQNAGGTGGGTWATNSAVTGVSSNGSYKFTNAVGDKATLTLPSGYPGGLPVAVALVLGQSTYDYTINVTVDGVAVASGLRVQGSALMDGGLVNEIVLRLRPTGGGNSPFDIAAPQLATSGAHTVVVSLASVTSGYLIVDYAQVEADPADGPVLLVPNISRPYSYSPWNSSAHGPLAGTDPMNDAAVATFNTQLAAVLTEFPSRSVLADIDTALNKDSTFFTVSLDGGGHPNGKGHAVIADTLYQALQASRLLTRRRQTRPSVLGPGGWLPFGQSPSGGARAGGAFSNSWTHYGTGYVPFAYHQDAHGRVHLRGAVKSGTSASAVIANLPEGCRPAAPLDFIGISSTNGLQRWQIAANGDISIASGGDTARSEVSGELIFTPDA